MREGFYRVDYQGGLGLGFAVMALDSGMVVGADAMGGTYDGRYEWNDRTQLLDVTITVHIPAGVQVVTGHTAPEGGLDFEVECSFPRKPDNEIVQVVSRLGPMQACIHLLRAFD